MLAAFLVPLSLPAPALASADEVIRDCSKDGRIDGKYSNEELRRARDNLPADLDEYSDCRDTIAAAIKGDSDRSGGTRSPGIGGTDPAGETAAQATDQSDLAAITQGEDAPPLSVGGNSVEPDDSGFFNLGGAGNELPLPLLLALILLCVLAIASGVGSLRERVPAIARVPLLSKMKMPSWRVPFIGRRS
jgi:hypothetical protein